MKKHKRTAGALGTVGSFSFGVLISFGALILFALIASIFLSGAKSPTKNLGAVSLAVFIAGAFLSGFVNSKRDKDNGVLFSVITSVAAALILLIVSLISSGGRVGGMHFMNCVCYMLMASFGAFVGKKRKRRHKRRT